MPVATSACVMSAVVTPCTGCSAFPFETSAIVNVLGPPSRSTNGSGDGDQPERQVSAFVSIQQGCNMDCAFCIVPKTRGDERSRPMDDIVRECEQLEHDDEAGRRWSALNYPGGYTSYNSASRMHELSPTFAQLKRGLDRHVALFAKSLEFDLKGRELQMTDCWVNVMPRQVVHSLHLHPLSFISGTYYVVTPPGCPGLKFEDPRLDRFMAAALSQRVTGEKVEVEDVE